MTCQKTNLPLFAATLLLGLSASIHAEGTWSFSSWTSGFTPSTDNLVRNVLPSSYSGLSNSEGGKNVAFLTDGVASPGDKGATQCLGNNAVLTWTFDSPVSIREVKVYTTWGDKNRTAVNVSSVVTDDQDALWAVDTLDFPWGNYPIMMGAATINSTNTYPNLARWESIDTGGDESDVYNRYAQIKITLTGAEDVDTDNQFKLLNDDYFSVSLSNKDVKKLKIRYVLTSRDLGSLSDDTVTYRLVSTTPLDGKTNIYIYKVVTK